MGRREGESCVVIPVLASSRADSRLTESDFGVHDAEIQQFTGQVSAGVCAKNSSPTNHSQRCLVPLTEAGVSAAEKLGIDNQSGKEGRHVCSVCCCDLCPEEALSLPTMTYRVFSKT